MNNNAIHNIFLVFCFYIVNISTILYRLYFFYRFIFIHIVAHSCVHSCYNWIMKTKSCSICGKALETRQIKYCSDCKNVTYNCERCGKEKTVSRDHYERVKHHFCSFNCSRWHVANGAAIARTKAAGGKAIVVCPNCGKKNERKQSNKDRLFCDRKCYGEYRKAHPEKYPANKPSEAAMIKFRQRTGKNNPMYGATGDKCVHWKGGRDKDRGKGWRTIRKLIKRRDGNKCMVCGTENAPQFDVHHIVNWARENINHPHNLITLCARCHQSNIHGPSPSILDHQLLALAQKSTRDQFSQDDLRLIAKLDYQQRCGKPVPQHLCNKLSLPDNYPCL